MELCGRCWVPTKFSWVPQLTVFFSSNCSDGPAVWFPGLWEVLKISSPFNSNVIYVSICQQHLGSSCESDDPNLGNSLSQNIVGRLSECSKIQNQQLISILIKFQDLGCVILFHCEFWSSTVEVELVSIGLANNQNIFFKESYILETIVLWFS